MKVLTFSRFFPAYHPKKGRPTNFTDKIWLWLINEEGYIYKDCPYTEFIVDDNWLYQDNPKYHTIRSGNRWKVGDWFSPRVWSGKPYQSKQIEFAPPIEVKKVWSFEVKENNVFLNGEEMPADEVGILANNDGLSFVDMMHWFKFPKPFKGQIISWSKNVNYQQ